MSTAIVEQPQTEIAVQSPAKTGILYSVTPETIAKRKAELMALKVNGASDEVGLATVKAGLREVVKWRTSVEATRKERKAEYLEAGRKVDEDAKQIQALIAPIEKHLADQTEAVQKELDRIEQEKQDKIYQARLARWKEAGGEATDRDYILSHREDVFDVLIENVATKTRLRKEAEAKAAAEEADRKRLAEEQAAENRRAAEELRVKQEAFDKQQKEAAAEQARLKAEQDAEAARLKQIEDDRIAADRAELKRQQDELQAERDRLAADKLASRRRLFAEVNAADVTDSVLMSKTDDEFTGYLDRLREAKARQEEARIQREQEEAELQRVREQEQAAERAAAELRAEEMKPIVQRVREFADKVELMALPDLPQSICDLINEDLRKCANAIRCTAGAIS